MKEKLHSVYNKYPSDFPLPLLLDGATGTALMSEGMPKGVCTECWAAEHKEALYSVQSGYIKSGSDAIYAPTFGGNLPSLERNGCTLDADELNSALAAITAENINRCTDRHILSGGDMSPTGIFIEPLGEASFDEIADIYQKQAESLSGKVDFFVIETMISLNEARAAFTGIRRVSDKPVFVTLTVNKDGRTMSGDSVLASLLTLADMGAAAVGCNCSVGPCEMLELLSPIVPYARALGVPLIAKPNAGMPKEDENGNSFFDMTADEFAAIGREFLENGIFILGGCCGTDRAYISALRSVIDNFDYSSVKDGGAEPLTDATGNEINPSDIGKYICNSRSLALPDFNREAIAAGDFLIDDVTDAFSDGAGCAVITLTSEDDIRYVKDAIPMLPIPVIFTGSRDIFEKIKPVYNGKTLFFE